MLPSLRATRAAAWLLASSLGCSRAALLSTAPPPSRAHAARMTVHPSHHSAEEEAKRAWLSRLDAPQWGNQGVQADDAGWVQPLTKDSGEPQMPLTEEEAKRAWLQRLGAPTWGRRDSNAFEAQADSLQPSQVAPARTRPVQAPPAAPTPPLVQSSGPEQSEEEAKRAWLARLETPSWGKQSSGQSAWVDQEYSSTQPPSSSAPQAQATPASEEDEKRAWVERLNAPPSREQAPAARGIDEEFQLLLAKKQAALDMLEEFDARSQSSNRSVRDPLLDAAVAAAAQSMLSKQRSAEGKSVDVLDADQPGKAKATGNVVACLTALSTACVLQVNSFPLDADFLLIVGFFAAAASVVSEDKESPLGSTLHRVGLLMLPAVEAAVAAAQTASSFLKTKNNESPTETVSNACRRLFVKLLQPTPLQSSRPPPPVSPPPPPLPTSSEPTFRVQVSPAKQRRTPIPSNHPNSKNSNYSGEMHLDL